MNFTKEELYWIERTADIESTLSLNKFLELTKVKVQDLSKEELDMIHKYSSELINTYNILKELRIKLEFERKNDSCY